MKNRKTLTFIICIATVIFVIYFFTQFQRTTYEFSLKTSLAFFGRDPQAFFDTYYDYYNTCEDFRTRAEINEKGNLVLRLNKKQEEAFLQSCDSQLEEIKRIKGVEISDDYRLLLIIGNRHEVAEIVANQIPIFTVFDMANRQLIVNKVNPEEITVEVKVVDENTGNMVYNAIWPLETVELVPGQWNFSQ